MDIQKEVIDCNPFPIQGELGRLYKAGEKVARVVTQVFHYMVQGGVEYGILTTGEAFAFLHILLDKPTTIYYHLAIPKDDVDKQKQLGYDYIGSTAVGQILAFTLHALKSAKQNQKELQDYRRKAMLILPRWGASSGNSIGVPGTKGQKTSNEE